MESLLISIAGGVAGVLLSLAATNGWSARGRIFPARRASTSTA